MATKKLTPKQDLFVKYYLIHLNATKAAELAGYSRKTAKSQGGRLLTNVDIAKAIEAGADKRAEKLEIDADWVLNRAALINDRCMQIAPVLNKKGEQVYCEGPEGEIVPAFTFDATGANKSLDTIGKHINVQAFKENINITKDEMTDLSDEELQAIIDGRSK